MAKQSKVPRHEVPRQGPNAHRAASAEDRRRGVSTVASVVRLLAVVGATSLASASAEARPLAQHRDGALGTALARVASSEPVAYIAAGGPVTISRASLSGAVVTVSGRVGGTGASAVRLTLTGSVGAARHRETFTAKLTSGHRFSIRHTTKLAATTALKVSAQEQAGDRLHGAAAVRAIKLPAPKVTLNAPQVSGQQITVSGRVSLAPDTAAERRLTTVQLTLVEALSATTSQTETFSAGIGAGDRFSTTHTTKLTGALGFDTQALVAGKAAGKSLVATINVTATVGTGSGGGSGSGGGTGTGSGGGAGGTGSGAGGGTGTGGSGSGGSGTGTGGGTGTPLVGTFDIDAGTQAVSGAISGSYFRMILPNGTQYFVNNDSAAYDPTYTLLPPGTDGGLSTAHFQEPPSPAFDTPQYVNGVLFTYAGNALANEIIQPINFYGWNFSIVTDPVDQQSINFTTQTGNGDPGTPVADPLPVIDVNPDGTLSGQVTAWNAQWNGTSFNQGTPKPDGTTPGYTTQLSGTYDAATHRYELDWKSQITGKSSFNGFTGQWHLVGTFVPAG